MSRPKVLFVTRKFPPSVGGMQRAAWELHAEVERLTATKLVKWGGSQAWLPVVYPWLLLRAAIELLTFRPDVIYLQDGLMGPLGWALRVVSGKPTVMTVHGLEVTYQNPFYDRYLKHFIRRQTHVACVSQETLQRARQALGELKSSSVVNNGVRDEFHDASASRATARALIREEADVDLGDLDGVDLLLTTGRLVKRKGVAWFVAHALPEVVKRAEKRVLYLVCGTGEDRQNIQRAIDEAGLQDHVHLLGRVSNELMRCLYNCSDLFLMPNVPVPGDLEGFGLVAVEASSCGTPVVAAGLEGIKDAVTSGKNGFLVPPEDADAFVETICGELKSPSVTRDSVREYTLSTYSWARVAEQYCELFSTVVSADPAAGEPGPPQR